jgi:probable phosphoglycerate mutase
MSEGPKYMQPSNKTVYLVRHGQSTDNSQPIFQSADAPLSKKGLLQAKKIAERLSSGKFDVIISSPILRAKETAATIARQSEKKLIFSDLFVERKKPKAIEGKQWTNVKAAKIWDQWIDDFYYRRDGSYKDAEYCDDIIQRAESALEYIKDRKEENFLIVTHGIFLQTLVARVVMGRGLDAKCLRRFIVYTVTDNTGITTIKYTDIYKQGLSWCLVSHNDHSHFEEE